MKRILVLNGPNLNLIGMRETKIYGQDTIETINAEIMLRAKELGVECEIFQSNMEGELINHIHEAMGKFDGIIINAGAYSHYSIAIRDAISSVSVPCVEVHFSNIFARDEFRRVSVISPVCVGHISGFGKNSYILALDALLKIVS